MILFPRNHYTLRDDKYLNRSINHEMCLQRVQKSTLFLFDDKRCYKNNSENKHWK